MTCFIGTDFFFYFFYFFYRLDIRNEALSLIFFFFRRAMRFSSDKLFVVAYFCYVACFP